MDTDWTESRNRVGTGQLNVISDAEFWGYKDYGANLLTRLTPNRGLEYLVGYDFQNYSGEDVVLLIAPNTERVHAVFGQVQTTRDVFSKGTASFGLRYNAPTNADGALVWTATGRYDLTPNVFARANVGVPLSRRLRAVRGRPDLLLWKPEPQAGIEHEHQRIRGNAAVCRSSNDRQLRSNRLLSKGHRSHRRRRRWIRRDDDYGQPG